MMKIHELKTDPGPFACSYAGSKPYEIRFADRDFHIGDMLILRETVNSGEAMKAGAPLEYTGRVLSRLVTDTRSGYGIKEGWIILGVSKI